MRKHVIIAAAATMIGVGGLIGCEVEEPAPVVYGPGIGVDVYYERGYYEGPNWVWRDRDGHIFREARERHESRMREYHEHNARPHEMHEEHHEEHR